MYVTNRRLVNKETVCRWWVLFRVYLLATIAVICLFIHQVYMKHQYLQCTIYSFLQSLCSFEILPITEIWFAVKCKAIKIIYFYLVILGLWSLCITDISAPNSLGTPGHSAQGWEVQPQDWLWMNIMPGAGIGCSQRGHNEDMLNNAWGGIHLHILEYFLITTSNVVLSAMLKSHPGKVSKAGRSCAIEADTLIVSIYSPWASVHNKLTFIIIHLK